MGDLLNKAEYVQTISEYDRNMLEKYEQLTKEIEKKEQALKKEEEELKTLQNDLIAKRDSVNQLLAEKEVQISSLEQQIGENAAKLQQLIKEAEEAKRRQAEAEAARRAAQAASSSGSSSSAGSSYVSGNGTLAYPVASPRITSGYGYRTAPTAGATSRHDGIDFGGATGTPIYASEAGTVVTASYNSARGNYVVVNHGNGIQTWYQHCSAVYVRAGQKVSRGQNIAAIGATGIVTGPHLHYEVHVNGTPVNPLSYL